MKLTRISWLVLAAGVIIIAFASLGIARAQQLHEQERVNEELSLTRRRLSRIQLDELYSRQEELERKLNETASQVEAARTILSQPIESIAASDALFAIARSCRVEITEIISSEPHGSKLEEIGCRVLSLSLCIEGDLPDLLSFVIKLNGDFVTGVVESVDINIVGGTDEERPSANIELLIYSYQESHGEEGRYGIH